MNVKQIIVKLNLSKQTCECTDLRFKITCLSPLRSWVRASLAPKTLCYRVSSYLRKYGGSTQSELFWSLSPPVKLEKSLNNLKCVKHDVNPFNSFKIYFPLNLHGWIEFILTLRKKMFTFQNWMGNLEDIRGNDMCMRFSNFQHINVVYTAFW